MVVSFDVGSLVWFDGDQGFLLPGHVVGMSGNSLKVQHEESNKVYSVPAKLALQRIDEGPHGVEDMIKIDDLNEGSILWNLSRRYKKDLFYTYIGKILVVVNPYKQHDIYTSEMVDKYTEKPVGILPPHLFAIGSAAYSEVQTGSSSQVIVISGESGAGKTESTKLLVQYLAMTNQTKGSLITEQIVEATPLLESFGNAKTIKNDNSSRFGKYLEMFFDSSGAICGGRISEYLLERSRIVSQSPEERNYHIFYEMLLGLSDEKKKQLELKSADEHNYLNQGRSSSIVNKDDVVSFKNVITAMEVLQITEAERDGIFTTLAAVLHLGDAGFYKGLASSHDVAVLRDENEAEVAARLLGLDQQDLIKALMHKQTEARGEQIFSPRNTEQAIDARDALAKEIYWRVFTWLVNRVNGMVFNGKQRSSIAILDIFGFEDFRMNSFEQLCINYANESLQFFFNQFIFKLEQDEYAVEGVEWHLMQYTDNQACLDLLARPPHGIMHLLSDESNFPKATDASFLEKCHQFHKASKAYVKPKTHIPEFAINHFAGAVWYKVNGFLDKNRDGLKQDLRDLLCKTSSEFVKDLIPDLCQDPEMEIGGLKVAKGKLKNSLKAPPNSLQKTTVCAKFNDSLIRLVVAMKRCNPFFIRCIKPNEIKAPNLFVDQLVMHQIRYCGILETVKIRKAGYPVRVVYPNFIKRYNTLSSQLALDGGSARQNASKIMEFMRINKERYQFGHTKIFMRESVERTLEEARMARQLRMAVLLQARMRGYIIQKKYLQMKKATIMIQSQMRRCIERRKYLRARRGFLMLQAIFRMKMHRKRLLEQIKTREDGKDEAPHSETVEEQTQAQQVFEETKDWKREPMVDVTHLEIPAELAMVYTNLGNWDTPFEGYIGLCKGELIKYECPSIALPKDIDNYPFSKFAQENFLTEHRWRMRPSPISNSFLKLNYSDAVESAAIFKLLMRFMEDETLEGTREFILGNYIIQRGILNPEIRDEIYCQLCNQTWGNPKESSNEKAWLLMALCMSTFMPSAALYEYLLKYSSDQAYDGYKNYCQHKMLCWKGRKFAHPRAYPPSSLEWQAGRKKAVMAMEFDCVDSDIRTVQVDSCMTGEQLAALLLKDRGIQEPFGWSVDLYDNNCHYSLSGHDYVLDVLSEYEYPPMFPPSLSPSLLTLRPNNSLSDKRKRAMSDLHKPHQKRAHVADIAHKFSFSERPASTTGIPSSPAGPREDALSAATSARLQQATPPRHQVDKLVSETAARSRADAPVDGPTAFVPAPPPPPAVNVPAPPPPPPPPVAPPDKVIFRKANKGKKKEAKKDAGPAYSLAEVVAKAKRMSETRSRALSSSSGGSANKEAEGEAFEAAIKLRQGNLKTRKVENTPKDTDQPDSELKRAMQAKANRVSRLWETSENKLEVMQGYKKPSVQKKDNEELKSRADQLHKSWSDPERKERSFSNASSSASNTVSDDYEPVTTIQVDEPATSGSSQAEYNGSTDGPEDVNKFVDSLFDPVISNFGDLMQEETVRIAIKGGGGVQPGEGANATTPLSTGISNTSVVSTPTAGITTPAMASMASPVFVPIAHTQLSNGYNPVINGYPGYSPGMVGPTYVPVVAGTPTPSYGSPGADVASLAAQQQVLIDRLLQQQQLLHQQQQELSQKSQEQLALLTKQHNEELRRIQEQLNARQGGMVNGLENGHSNASSGPGINGYSTPPSGAFSPSTSTTSFSQSEQLSATVSDIQLPPPEFSDANVDPSEFPAPPPPLIAKVPPPPPPRKDEIIEPSPPQSPPPSHVSNGVPETPNSVLNNEGPLKSPGVASAVATFEAKTPNSPTTKTPDVSFATSATRSEAPAAAAAAAERPPLRTRLSSASASLIIQEKKITKAYNKLNAPVIKLERKGWKTGIRKEIFAANEKMDNKLVQRLVFLQIVRDAYSDACCRMTAEDRTRMKALLQKYGVTPEHPHSSMPVEEIVIETARQMRLYFCRYYLATHSNEHPDVHYIAVGEHGIWLVKREKLQDDLSVVLDFPYDDLEKVKAVKNKLTISTKESKVTVSTEKAEEIKLLIGPYLRQLEKEAKYVRAMYDYVTQENNLLNFKKGDVIQVIDKPDLEEGWLFGMFDSRNGYFPAEYVTHIKEYLSRNSRHGTPRHVHWRTIPNKFKVKRPPRYLRAMRHHRNNRNYGNNRYQGNNHHQGHNGYQGSNLDPGTVRKGNIMKAASLGNLFTETTEESPKSTRSRRDSVRSSKSDKSEYGTEKYSMMEFAMHYFRHGQEVVHRQSDGSVRGTLRIKGSGTNRHIKKLEWTWKGLAELVKYTKTPIQVSLLRLEHAHNKQAVECFQAIMRFMGDLPMGRNHRDTDLVYFLLKTCREQAILCDEVYCQLVKQVTSNKSANVDSCSRGWRLLIIMTSYVECGENLKPYLVKFLQSTASDPKREFHGAAAICEQNLMKTFKYGGRRTPPSPMELKQLVQGRQTKRQVFLLPGMVSKMLKIQTCSTGYDVVKEMCNEMDLHTEDDYREYGVFTQLVKQNLMVPVQTTDYVMDVIGQLERQEVEFSLWFKRVLWYQPCRFDNELYVSIIYNQVIPNYMRGHLVGIHSGRTLGDAQFQNEVAEIGALQVISANSTLNTPVQSDVENVVPKFMRERLRSQQWLILVQDHFRGFVGLSPHQARRKILEKMSKWPFFGSSFYAVKHCSNPSVAGECLLAINKQGIHFINSGTKQTMLREPFLRIISTRILVSDKKRFFLDLKIGDEMVQKVTRMETLEAKDIANLIYSYVSMQSEELNRPNEGLAGVLRSQQDLRL